MVVHWRKLGEVVKEYTLHNFILLAMSLQKIVKVGWNLSYDENHFDCFFETRHIQTDKPVMLTSPNNWLKFQNYFNSSLCKIGNNTLIKNPTTPTLLGEIYT